MTMCQFIVIRIQAFTSLYALINAESTLSIKPTLLIYKSVTRVIIAFASPVWGNLAKTKLQPLHIIQNKLLKAALGLGALVHDEARVPLLKDYIANCNTNFNARYLNNDDAFIQNIQAIT